MKQGMRLFVQPGTFFNQLQWSKHHWYILFAFLFISAIEAHVGKQHSLYQVYANFLAQNLGLGFDIALWTVVASKLVLMLIGAFVTASLIWFVGNLIGAKNSRRVLFRRLAIVFTVGITAYTTKHLEPLFPWMGTASFFLYFWALLLGYFALREQFVLTHLETAFVAAFSILLVISSWHYSNHLFERAARHTLQEIAFKPAKVQSVRPKY